MKEGKPQLDHSWFIKYLDDGSMILVGSVIHFVCHPLTNPPDGYLPCDGRSLDKKKYADLYRCFAIRKYVVFGSKVPELRSVYGETETTFRLPDFRAGTGLSVPTVKP
jgi:hypothetical protein